MQNEQYVLYVRCSTREQSDSGIGLESQRRALIAECERRGISDYVMIEDAGYSAKDLKRPGIRRALGMLANGEAAALMVYRLDRLSRSLLDGAGIAEQARQEGWSLIALDLGLDQTTPQGRMASAMMLAAAAYERELISLRCIDTHAVQRARGRRMGRKRRTSDATMHLVVEMREAGMTLQGIADQLNADGVTTATGRRWWSASVASVLKSATYAQELAAA